LSAHYDKIKADVAFRKEVAIAVEFGSMFRCSGHSRLN